MARRTAKKPTASQVVPLDLESLAKAISGDQPLAWLVPHFLKWLPSVRLAYQLSQKRPTRAGVKKSLERIATAADILCRELPQMPTIEFLHPGERGPIPAYFPLWEQLNDLSQRAQAAQKLPGLSSPRGGARAGRGKAYVDMAISARTLCAGMIAETYKFLRGRDPAPRNRDAALAAELLWRLSLYALFKDSKEKPRGWGSDPLNAWRRYFNLASALRAKGSSFVAEYVRQMEEDASRQADTVSAAAAIR
jgi:hypothetical protein